MGSQLGDVDTDFMDTFDDLYEDVTYYNKSAISYQMLGDDSEYLLDGDRSQDCNLQGLANERETKIYEELDTLVASTSSEEVLVELPNSSTLLVNMCEVVRAHDESDHEESTKNTVLSQCS